MKITVYVEPENLDHPGSSEPSHYEECDACRDRLHVAIEQAIILFLNRPGAIPDVGSKVFVGSINKYELIGNSVILRKRSSTSWRRHDSKEMLPGEWAATDER